jgi:hypothetical protein
MTSGFNEVIVTASAARYAPLLALLLTGRRREPLTLRLVKTPGTPKAQWAPRTLHSLRAHTTKPCRSQAHDRASSE